MRKRILIIASCLLAFPAAARAQEGPAEAPRSKRPNVVFLMADQLRRQSLGYAGDPRAKTPNLDRLAAEGVDFTNYVVSMPVCTATRASLLTGKYASTTGMVVNELRINPNQETLGHVLTRAGYQTGFIGKWHLWSKVAFRHDKDEYQFVPPGPYRLGFDGEWAGFNFNHESYDAFYFRDTPQRIKIDGYEPDAQTDLAIDFLRRHAESGSDDGSGEAQPFALCVWYGAPHDPWTRENVPDADYQKFADVEFPLPETWSDTPDPYMDRETDPERWLDYWKPNLEDMQRVYYAMTHALDRNVGRVLEELTRLGLDRDTIVVFTSDHGETFGAHGRIYKLTFYDEACRVPMLVRWPGQIPAGLDSDACMASPDTMPTLLGLLDLPIPEDVEGMDLAPLARGLDGPEPPFAFLQGMGHTVAWQDGFEWRAVRDKRYTYAIYRVDGHELLFDNVDDPLQSRNLADDPARRGTLDTYRGKLRGKMAGLNDTFEPSTWYRDHWTEDRVVIRGAKGDFDAP